MKQSSFCINSISGKLLESKLAQKPAEQIYELELTWMKTLPSGFVDSITRVHGAKGELWLDTLPSVLLRISDEWCIKLNEEYHCITYSLIAMCIGEDGRELVLKATVPGQEFENQIAALRCYNGTGAVQMIQANIEEGLLLMESVQPGNPLTNLATDITDSQATSIAVTVMQKLWTDPPTTHPFPTVANWLEGLSQLNQQHLREACPFPIPLVDEAIDLARDLLATSSAPVILHGDLHHDNILSSKRAGWLAIDPKGVIGEPAYETGAILRNLWLDRAPIPNPVELIHRRIDQFAEELSIDKSRIRGWGIVQAVLAAWWCLQDNLDCWQGMIYCAEIIAKVKD